MGRNKRLFLENEKLKRTWLCNFIRWCCYVVLILYAFLFANSGDFIKPMWMVPMALCIASVSGMFTAGAVGIVCGFLMDISGGTLIGYRAMVLFLLCMAMSILYDRMMQQHFLNTLIFTAIAAFLITGFDFVFRYWIWEYDHLAYLYTHYSLRILLYTVLSAVVCHPVFRLIHKFFLPARKQTVEKKVKSMDE
ncbi:MAG: hypothetical protein LIO74_11680 [Ruminococcus sp.]|nr:hypothetical protein [Ruminococcus sp.]